MRIKVTRSRYRAGEDPPPPAAPTTPAGERGVIRIDHPRRAASAGEGQRRKFRKAGLLSLPAIGGTMLLPLWVAAPSPTHGYPDWPEAFALTLPLALSNLIAQFSVQHWSRLSAPSGTPDFLRRLGWVAAMFPAVLGALFLGDQVSLQDDELMQAFWSLIPAASLGGWFLGRSSARARPPTTSIRPTPSAIPDPLPPTEPPPRPPTSHLNVEPAVLACAACGDDLFSTGMELVSCTENPSHKVHRICRSIVHGNCPYCGRPLE